MEREIPSQLQQITWLPPWEPTTADFASELARELARGHVLHGKPAIAVARRVDQDDVLFWLPDGPALLAVVHLTYAGRERRKEWPSTELFRSIDEWVETRMQADHEERLGTSRDVEP